MDKLYREGDSPLRYRINRLGGRSQQEKWILQAELFNELHRWVGGEWRKIQRAGGSVTREADRYYAIVRDFLKACQKVWTTSWGHPNYMVTKPVTLKAMIRVCADLARDDAEPADGRQAALGEAARAVDRAHARVPHGRLLRALPRQGRRSSASRACTATWRKWPTSKSSPAAAPPPERW